MVKYTPDSCRHSNELHCEKVRQKEETIHLTYLLKHIRFSMKCHVDHLKTAPEDPAGETAMQATEFSSTIDYLPPLEVLSNTAPCRETTPRGSGNEIRLFEPASHMETRGP